jgi:predicted AlkP superfamily phosphohydrolase/phosphomutase
VIARTKLLVIGLDAASAPLVRAWAAMGMLPNLATLMRQGRTASMRGVDGFFTGSTWPSLLTGTNPAHHGIHYLVQLVPGTYQYARPHEAEYIRAPVLWETLSKAGKRLAILDVPLSKLDPAIRGIQTVEWGGHDAIFGFQTAPASLAGEILAQFGAHPVPSNCDADGRTRADFQQFVETLIRGVEIKTQLTISLLERESWDLFFQVFTETHCVGHQCWHLHDPSHPAYDPAVAEEQGNPVLRVYQAVDKAIAELITAAGNPPTMVVLSHGMSHSYGPHLLLPEILFRLGYAVRRASVARRAGPMDVMRGLYRWLPERVRAIARPWKDRLIRPGTSPLPTLGVDPTASRCFDVPNGLAVSGIRLNIIGREPHGLVAAGQSADRLFEDLTRDLLEIQDDRTGQPLARRVLRTADLYQGPHLDALPDILVEWNDDVAPGSTTVGRGTHAMIRARSAKIGVVEALNKYGRTGEHRPEGLLIASGPGIDSGGDDLLISILDVAPTITAALGVDLAGAEGRPIAAMTPCLTRR